MPTAFPHGRWRLKNKALGLLLAMQAALPLLAGAAFAAPAEPSNTATQASAPQQLPWWRDFNDPTLTQLIDQALQANTSIRTAQAALQQARALRDVRQASQLPRLNASGSASRSQVESGDPVNSFSAGLDASWELDVFGANRSGTAAAEADAQAAGASLRDAQVSVAAEVALAYIQLRAYQTQLGIAQRNLGSQQETLQITQWRAQAGLTTALEVAQAQTAVAQTSAQIPALQASMAQTRHSLALLTGQRPRDLDALLSPPGALPQARLASAIPADALRQRADVRAAEWRIQAALARVDAADAARWPSFNLGGTLSLSAATLAGLGSGATLAGKLLGSVSVPWFDGGATQAQVLAQQAALEQARSAYQSAVLTALKEVEDALIALDKDGERLQQLQDAASAAEQAALLAQNRYASGLIDFQTVLQTQRTLLGAQDSAASAQASHSADHVRLIKALGGGWRTDASAAANP